MGLPMPWRHEESTARHQKGEWPDPPPKPAS